ncbi:hypothetical protein HGRIS_005991 [Hohenbuehelia grisea]|uniref:F-box domain-containing protein n=1 Tax=Hohenbuehelia grisea TaxID=104357 RepID=A0ABR3K0H6_9AGAR
MLSQLPVEIVLCTFSHLPITALVELRLVSKEWKALFDENDEAIFHQAAVYHEYIPSLATMIFDLPLLYPKRYVMGVTSWRALFRRVIDISRSWEGRGPSIITKHSADTRVHRFKVDEQAGYIIHTSSLGSLTVSDLSSGQILWELGCGMRYVRRYAHCEYGEGYIMFDRYDGSKEVWRRACDFDADTPCTASPPDILQIESSAHARRLSQTDTRGHFKPWALLRMPVPTRAYRFVYPILLVAGTEAAFLWDVPSGRLVLTIEGLQPDDLPVDGTLNINYVELSDRHAFICMTDGLRVFSRESGACVLVIPSTKDIYGEWAYSLGPTQYSIDVPMDSALLPLIVERTRIHGVDNRVIHDTYVAAHVSSCGSNLVCMLKNSRLIIIYGFERLISGTATLREIALDVQLGSPMYSSVYLAFEHGRIGMVTTTGVFVVCPDFDSADPPHLDVCRILTFTSRFYLPSTSCLQMTRTGLFLNWPVHSWDPMDLEDGMDWFNETLEEPPCYIEQEDGSLVPDAHPVFETRSSSAIYEVNFVRSLYDPEAVQVDLSRRSTL